MSIVDLLQKTREVEQQSEQFVNEEKKKAQEITMQAEAKARTLESDVKKQIRKNQEMLIFEAQKRAEKEVENHKQKIEKEKEKINSIAQKNMEKAIQFVTTRVIEFSK